MHFGHLLLKAVVISSSWAVSLPRSSGNEGHKQLPIVDSGSESAPHSTLDCKLPPIRAPLSSDGLPDSTSIFTGEKALEKQVERLGEVVKVPSICYDDLGGFDSDSRWQPFDKLHDVLEEVFPLVYKYTEVTKVNRYGLVYTLYGTNSGLSPALFTAHQDVVPVQDASTWTYPPFSAHFDGTFLWGRGASDDKNSLVGLMSVLETLLSQATPYKPQRTIIFAFGFDEECSGLRGAGHIAEYLESRWGPRSISMILDEGGMGFKLLDGNTLYALPSVHEKGHMDIWFDLQVNGGHSSTPFPHTGIGIMAEIITILESHPYSPKLTKDNPLYSHLVCQAQYSPDANPKITKLLLEGKMEDLADELASIDRATQFLIQTSQAVDIVAGGAKINAMPESVTLGVNYRIASHNSAHEIQQNILGLIAPVVEKYGIGLKAFVDDGNRTELEPAYEVEYNASLMLTAPSFSTTPPSPISPTKDSPVWDLFAGTIRHSYAFNYSLESSQEPGLVVPAPELMTGNTDTRHYVNLSENIYRFTPSGRNGERSSNAHTVNEKMLMEDHLGGCRFYYDLIRNITADTDID